MADKLCVCEFAIPNNYNNGSPIPMEKMHMIQTAIRRQFGGITNLGVRTGIWEEQTEDSTWLRVYVAEHQVAALRAVVIEIGKELGQKAMAFETRPDSAEILDTEEGA